MHGSALRTQIIHCVRALVRCGLAVDWQATYNRLHLAASLALDLRNGRLNLPRYYLNQLRAELGAPNANHDFQVCIQKTMETIEKELGIPHG